jgi:hypothetical protein
VEIVEKNTVVPTIGKMQRVPLREAAGEAGPGALGESMR